MERIKDVRCSIALYVRNARFKLKIMVTYDSSIDERNGAEQSVGKAAIIWSNKPNQVRQLIANQPVTTVKWCVGSNPAYSASIPIIP